MAQIGVIDYGGGNLRSLCRAVESLGYEVKLVKQSSELEGVTHLLYPGQGAYGDCLRKLKERGLVDAVLQWISDDRPFFGICVGYQLLFAGSEEAPDEKGFNLLEGRIVKFESDELKVPHMGWNVLKINDPTHPLWKGMPENPYFYFVHSYYSIGVDSELEAGVCNYGEDFSACVIRGNLLATQFHPEKSQDNGLLLLKNFLEL